MTIRGIHIREVRSDGNTRAIFIGTVYNGRSHRPVIGPVDCYGHRLGRGATIAVIHRVGEGIRRALTCAEAVKSPRRIIAKGAIAIVSHSALGAGGIHAEAMTIRGIHIREVSG